MEPTFIAGIGRLFSPLLNLLFRSRRLADQELGEFRKELQSLLGLMQSSSVEAQTAVRGSPNEPATQDAHSKAIREATEVGQQFACLFDVTSIAHTVPANLIAARQAYREAVTDETNVELIDPELRAAQCSRIEEACAEFHRLISGYALTTWGTGVGAKSGRQKGRKFPN